MAALVKNILTRERCEAALLVMDTSTFPRIISTYCIFFSSTLQNLAATDTLLVSSDDFSVVNKTKMELRNRVKMKVEGSYNLRVSWQTTTNKTGTC